MDERAVIGEIAAHNCGTIGSINVVVHQVREVKHVEKYPEGSIGREVAMHLYLDYIVGRYFYYKMQEFESAVGTKEHAAEKKEAFGRLNGAIKSRFGGYRMRLPASKFTLVADYLKACVDYTIAGKQAVSEGKPRYMTFEEHQALGS